MSKHKKFWAATYNGNVTYYAGYFSQKFERK